MRFSWNCSKGQVLHASATRTLPRAARSKQNIRGPTVKVERMNRCKCSTKEPERFGLDPNHQMPEPLVCILPDAEPAPVAIVGIE